MTSRATALAHSASSYSDPQQQTIMSQGGGAPPPSYSQSGFPSNPLSQSSASAPPPYHAYPPSMTMPGNNNHLHSRSSEGLRPPPPLPQTLSFPAQHRDWTCMTRTIAHYERLEQIGEGTYGQVYRARCKDTNQIVALKKIRVHHGGYWGMPPTVIREIKILKRLRHENLVTMVEVVSSKGVEHLDDDDEVEEKHKVKESVNHHDKILDAREGYKGNLFLVLEYVTHDLTGLMDLTYRFSEVQVKVIFRQLLKALEYMHEQKCIEPPIMDNLHDRGSTQEFTNKVITLWYRPPEILLGATRYGTPVDVWSAGCILAELLLGKPLLPGKTEMDQLQLIFDLMGTPTPESWDGFQDLKLMRTGEVTIEKPRKSKLREKYAAKMPPTALNLLEKLLELDPAKRLTASKALQNRYFLAEPRAPDRPEELGPIQLEGGHFHEFQTKKKRREAKALADVAREEAKARGVNDKDAEAAYDEVYRGFMRKVAEQGCTPSKPAPTKAVEEKSNTGDRSGKDNRGGKDKEERDKSKDERGKSKDERGRSDRGKEDRPPKASDHVHDRSHDRRHGRDERPKEGHSQKPVDAAKHTIGDRSDSKLSKDADVRPRDREHRSRDRDDKLRKEERRNSEKSGDRSERKRRESNEADKHSNGEARKRRKRDHDDRKHDDRKHHKDDRRKDVERGAIDDIPPREDRKKEGGRELLEGNLPPQEDRRKDGGREPHDGDVPREGGRQEGGREPDDGNRPPENRRKEGSHADISLRDDRRKEGGREPHQDAPFRDDRRKEGGREPHHDFPVRDDRKRDPGREPHDNALREDRRKEPDRNPHESALREDRRKEPGRNPHESVLREDRRKEPDRNPHESVLREDRRKEPDRNPHDGALREDRRKEAGREPPNETPQRETPQRDRDVNRGGLLDSATKGSRDGGKDVARAGPLGVPAVGDSKRAPERDGDKHPDDRRDRSRDERKRDRKERRSSRESDRERSRDRRRRESHRSGTSSSRRHHRDHDRDYDKECDRDFDSASKRHKMDDRDWREQRHEQFGPPRDDFVPGRDNRGGDMHSRGPPPPHDFHHDPSWEAPRGGGGRPPFDEFGHHGPPPPHLAPPFHGGGGGDRERMHRDRSPRRDRERSPRRERERSPRRDRDRSPRRDRDRSPRHERERSPRRERERSPRRDRDRKRDRR